MINLFEEKNPNIIKTGDSKSPIFNIASNEALEIIISWKNYSFEKVTLNIRGNGKISILESCDASNANVEINLAEGTNVEHSIAFFGGNNTIDYVVNEASNASYTGALADFTSGDNKFDFICNLKGDYSKALWNLASLACEKDNKTFTVSFYHYGKHSFARMENYGVCENESSLNFFGTSSIIKGAKGTSTHQSAKIMVFDPKCKAKASPSLCIDENDVQASHASVVGQINEDHIYYFMTRGIEEEEAKKLITLGYLNPIMRYFKDEATLNKIKENIEGRF